MPGRPIYGRKKARDKRAAPRYALNVPVDIACGGSERKGQVHDISALGIRVEKAGLQPSEGTVVSLKLSLYANSIPLSFEARVVRHTGTGGFCVEFVNLDARVERVLRSVLPKIAAPITDDAAAVTSGKFELDIGSDLHEQIAEIARGRGVETIDWVVNEIEKSAKEAAKREGPKAPVQIRTSRDE
jgi:hypothetical protein